MNAYDKYIELYKTDRNEAQDYLRDCVARFDGIIARDLNAFNLPVDSDFLLTYCAAHALRYGEEFCI